MLSIKDHGLVLIDEYSMLQMRANGLRENGLLQILSFANQVFHAEFSKPAFRPLPARLKPSFGNSCQVPDGPSL